jgi:hypothetical protein
MPHLNRRGPRHSLTRPAARASERRQGLVLSSLDSRLPVSLALICGVMLALSIMLLPTTSYALGETRVKRHCGTNLIKSVSHGPYSEAWTLKVSGSCAGRLSVALGHKGYETPRYKGDASGAYIIANINATYGVHWGCDQCEKTYS